MKNAHIAQSVEHFLGKEEVTGSNPVVGSRTEHITKFQNIWHTKQPTGN